MGNKMNVDKYKREQVVRVNTNSMLEKENMMVTKKRKQGATTQTGAKRHLAAELHFVVQGEVTQIIYSFLRIS